MPQSRQDYIEDLRNFLRDKEPLNRLLDFDLESSDEELGQALDYAIDEINVAPPVLSKEYEIDSFPHKSLLLRGAAIWLLQSAGILQSRNQLSYSDGGVTVEVSNKAGQYQSWIQSFSQQFYRQLRSFKLSENMDRAWGGFTSDYDRGFW